MICARNAHWVAARQAAPTARTMSARRMGVCSKTPATLFQVSEVFAKPLTGLNFQRSNVQFPAGPIVPNERRFRTVLVGCQPFLLNRLATALRFRNKSLKYGTRQALV